MIHVPRPKLIMGPEWGDNSINLIPLSAPFIYALYIYCIYTKLSASIYASNSRLALRFIKRRTLGTMIAYYVTICFLRCLL